VSGLVGLGIGAFGEKVKSGDKEGSLVSKEARDALGYCVIGWLGSWVLGVLISLGDAPKKPTLPTVTRKYTDQDLRKQIDETNRKAFLEAELRPLPGK